MTLPREAVTALMQGDWDAYDRTRGVTPRPRRRPQQLRVDSFMEAVTNTAIGFVVSLVTWIVLARALGIPMTWHENLLIIGVFTVVSIARQYVLRRLFDGRSPWSALRDWWLGSRWVRRVEGDDLLSVGWDRGRGMEP